MKLNEDPWETRKPLIHDTIHILSQAELKFEGKVSEICKNAHKNVIHDLQVYFDQILAEFEHEPTISNILIAQTLIYELSLPHNLKSLLTAIKLHPQLLSNVQHESSHHDLFDKVVLLSSINSTWKVRMHVFNERKNLQSVKDEVHTHRNHFISSILIGGLTQSIWEEPRFLEANQPQLEVVDYCRTIYCPSSMNYIKNPQSEARQIQLAKIQMSSHLKGEFYYMHTSVLHSVEDIKDPTVTLVLHFPQTQKQACFATLRPWQNKDFIRLDFTDREIEDKLEFVLKLISNSEPIK